MPVWVTPTRKCRRIYLAFHLSLFRSVSCSTRFSSIRPPPFSALSFLVNRRKNEQRPSSNYLFKYLISSFFLWRFSPVRIFLGRLKPSLKMSRQINPWVGPIRALTCIHCHAQIAHFFSRFCPWGSFRAFDSSSLALQLSLFLLLVYSSALMSLYSFDLICNIIIIIDQLFFFFKINLVFYFFYRSLLTFST